MNGGLLNGLICLSLSYLKTHKTMLVQRPAGIKKAVGNGVAIRPENPAAPKTVAAHPKQSTERQIDTLHTHPNY